MVIHIFIIIYYNDILMGVRHTLNIFLGEKCVQLECACRIIAGFTFEPLLVCVEKSIH